MLALVGHASPCGCILHVYAIDGTDTPTRVRRIRRDMRRQGLRVQERPVERARVQVCRHGPRRSGR